MRIILSTLFLLSACTGLSAKETPNFIGLSLGAASAQIDGYESSSEYSFYLGREFSFLTTELGYQEQSRFNRIEGQDSYLAVAGPYFSLAYPFSFDQTVGLEPSIGFYSWNATATRFGQEWGTDEGYSLQAGLDLTLNIMQARIDLGARFMDQVSGSDIMQGQISAQFHF
jgi:hypothetical protein